MSKNKFTRKTAEELAAMSQEDKLAYFEALTKSQDAALKAKSEQLKGLTAELNAAGTQEKAGRTKFTYEGEEYIIRGANHFLNPKCLLNDKSERQAAKNDSGKWFTTKEILSSPELIKLLIENGSEIIKAVSQKIKKEE